MGPRESCHQEPPRVEGLLGFAPFPLIQRPMGLSQVLSVDVAVVEEELAIEFVGALKTRRRALGASVATTWAL